MGQNAQSPIRIEKSDTQLAITIAGRPFTTYRFVPTPEDPKWNRPYFFPVLAADGTPVTSDQWRLGRKEKADHPWHRSIYVGWGDVNGIDHWRLSKYQQRHVAFTHVGDDTFTETVRWDGKSPDQPVLTETRTVRILVYSDGSRGIDLSSTLTAASGDAVFKCLPLNKTGVEAGLCSVRVAKGISKDPKHEIVSSAGAHGEKAARAEPADWCDYSGLIDGRRYGVAMVSDPGEPGGITPWAVRDFGLFAHIGPLNWTLRKGESATFRHLIILHAGDAVAAQINVKAEAWRASIAPRRENP